MPVVFDPIYLVGGQPLMAGTDVVQLHPGGDGTCCCIDCDSLPSTMTLTVSGVAVTGCVTYGGTASIQLTDLGGANGVHTLTNPSGPGGAWSDTASPQGVFKRWPVGEPACGGTGVADSPMEFRMTTICDVGHVYVKLEVFSVLDGFNMSVFGYAQIANHQTLPITWTAVGATGNVVSGGTVTLDY